MDGSHIIVDAFAGAKGEETPRAFTHEGSRRTVTEIVTRWYTRRTAISAFKLTTDIAMCCGYDLDKLIWELVMCETTDGGT